MRKNLAGREYGLLTVLRYVKTDKNRHSVWECRCSCGTIVEVLDSSLNRGLTKSCGCYNSVKNLIHGMAAKTIPEEHRATYQSWKSMKGRCENIADAAYASYGGRGITVCERWGKFENFLEDMGAKESIAYTIERTDVNKDYNPDNCIWLHKKLQAQNKRNTIIVEVLGEKMCLAEACRKYKKNRATIAQRMRTGMTAEEALLCDRDMRYSIQ